MSNIDNIITDIKAINNEYEFWIRNTNGEIKDEIICGDIIPLLEELKDYEIDISQKDIIDMININYNQYIKYHNKKYFAENTYNNNANIDHDIDYRIFNTDDGIYYFAFMVHRYGDIRGNYTDWAICKFNYMEELFELESMTQHKFFGGHYIADIYLFDEGYDVYDCDLDFDLGKFYEIEIEDAIKEIESESNNDDIISYVS